MRIGILAAACGVVALTAAGCGGASRDEKITQVVSSFEQGAGVDFPDSETQCMGSRLVDNLKDADLKLDDPAKLSPEGRAEIIATLDACYSPASVELGLKKSLAGQLPSADAVTCVSREVAKTIKLGQILKAGLDPNAGLDQPTKDAIAAAVQVCAKP